MLTPLQLHSVHIPSCDRTCTFSCDAEEVKDNVKREFGWQNIVKEGLNIF